MRSRNSPILLPWEINDKYCINICQTYWKVYGIFGSCED